jgi:hypothetical protein
MPLEDLVGPDKYLDALVITNPEGADEKSEGDDHIRGVKNTLINTFGPLDAPVDLSAVGPGPWGLIEYLDLTGLTATQHALEAGYDYKFVWTGASLQTDGSVSGQVSATGTSGPWDGGATDYQQVMTQSAAGAVTGDARAGNALRMFFSQMDASANLANPPTGEAILFHPNDPIRNTTMHSSWSAVLVTDQWGMVDYRCQRSNAAPHVAVQWSTGGIAWRSTARLAVYRRANELTP